MIENEFRVWCKNKSEWEKDEVIMTKEGNLFEIKYATNKLFPLRKDTHLVSFYTGLKDNKGKKIYKGDIVSDGDSNFEVYQHDCGEWKAGQYCLWEYISDDGTENSWEVVGNIYENANLLN